MIIINPTTGKDVKDNRFNSFVDKVVQYLYDHHKPDFCKLIKLVSSNLAIDYGAARMISAFYNSATNPRRRFPRKYEFSGIVGYFYLCKDWQEMPRKDNRDYNNLGSMIAKIFPSYTITKVGKEYQLVDSSSARTSPSTASPYSTSFKTNSNIILYGPPGTGKTYHTIEKAVEIIDGIDPSRTHEDAKKRFDKLKEKGQIVFTTFHQSMSYEDFIEGIKPKLGRSSLSYIIEDGIFKQISNAAQKNIDAAEVNKIPADKYVLIIDEINRGNVANIFGELITLIEEDKRIGNKEGMTCTLPYSKEKFGVPNNLYIIGTMNTADRSVEALDTALRRRFTFEEMMPKPELLSADVEGVDLQKFLDTINKRICLLKDREHQIGHSYFMNMKVTSKETLIDVIFKNVIPLLQEYFYGDYEKIQMVLGETFIPEDDTLKVGFAASSGSYEPEKVYRIAGKDDIKIDDALESIKFGFTK